MNLLLLALLYVTIAVLSIWLLKLRDDRREQKQKLGLKHKRVLLVIERQRRE